MSWCWEEVLSLHFFTFKKASIFLQETHADINNQKQWLSEWNSQCFLSHGSNMSAGVPILFSIDIQEQPVNTVEIIPERMQRVDGDFHKPSFSLINIYSSNLGTDIFSFLVVWIKPSQTVPKKGGDFSWWFKLHIESQHRLEPRWTSSLLSRGTQNCNTKPQPTRCVEGNFTYRQYTWVKSTPEKIQKARLDRFYSQSFNRGRFYNSYIHPTPLSDHHYTCHCQNLTEYFLSTLLAL